MTTNEIIAKTLSNLNITPSAENLFIFETLLDNLLKGKKVKRITLINLLKEKEITDLQIKNILDSLNKSNVIKWEVIKGVSIVKLTKEAKAAFAVAYVSITGKECGKNLEDVLALGEEAINDFLDTITKEGKQWGKRLKKNLSKTFREMASKLEKNN
jgi:hypothetical protein